MNTTSVNGVRAPNLIVNPMIRILIPFLAVLIFVVPVAIVVFRLLDHASTLLASIP